MSTHVRSSINYIIEPNPVATPSLCVNAQHTVLAIIILHPISGNAIHYDISILPKFALKFPNLVHPPHPIIPITSKSCSSFVQILKPV